MSMRRLGLQQILELHEMNELIGDSKRQAVHTLEAYSYQVWQSLWRWLNLKESEALFLEGAEDIDFHGPNGGRQSP